MSTLVLYTEPSPIVTILISTVLVRIGKAISTCMYLNLSQLFYSFFKSLVGKEVIVELKNDLW